MNLNKITELADIVRNRVILDNQTGCKIYYGPKKNQYGVVQKKIDGVTYRLYAHRVVKLESMGLTEAPPGMICSHRCHRVLCCEPMHINFERQSSNNQRKNCNFRQQCSGHFDPYTRTPLPDCIFQ